jgi:DNA polymerase III subunit epsilon
MFKALSRMLGIAPNAQKPGTFQSTPLIKVPEFPGQAMFFGRRTVAIDVETTGLDPFAGEHRVITFAGVEFVDGIGPRAVMYLIFNPERASDRAAREVHGFDSFLLAHQDGFGSWASEIRDWIGDADVVAHNASFDIDFLNEEFRRANVRPIESDRVSCTMTMFRNHFEARGMRPPSARLDNVCSHFGLGPDRGKVHSAVEDAVLCASAYFTLKTGFVRKLRIVEALEPSNLKPPPFPPKRNAREVTREMALEAMAQYKTKTAAAKALGVSPTTIAKRLNSGP